MIKSKLNLDKQNIMKRKKKRNYWVSLETEYKVWSMRYKGLGVYL